MAPLFDEITAAARRQAQTPAWALAIVATIAVGVGAVTAIYSVVDAVALRPLPFADSERVVIVCETSPTTEGFCVASPPNAADWRRAATGLDAVGVARGWPFKFEDDTGRSSVRGAIATAEFFDVVAARAAHGRLPTESDLESGANRVAVLSERFWLARFQGDLSVIGRVLRIDDQATVVIGVLAEPIGVPQFEPAEIWLPLTAVEDDVDARSWRGFTVLARLAPGVSLAAARSEMETIRAQLASVHPETNAEWGVKLHRLRRWVAGTVRPTLWMLLAAVGVLLAIACANVAHLLLAQASRRETEMAVRAALGAGRTRIARQLLIESLVLAVTGGLVGTLLAAASLSSLRRLAPPDLPRLAEVGIDLRVLIVSLAVTIASAIAFGALPAARTSRVDLSRALSSSRGTVGRRSRSRDLLVVLEIALALLLLAGSTLLVRGFDRLLQWQPGFDAERTVSLALSLSGGRYPTGEQAVAAFERAAAEIAALPGVEATTLASAGPLFGGNETTEIERGDGAVSDAASPSARWFDVGPGYFDLFGIPVRGREFDRRDQPRSEQVAIVNRTLAERLWPGEEALGRSLVAYGTVRRIVGVADDLPAPRPDAPAIAEVFWPQRQFARWGTHLVFRRSPSAVPLERSIRERLAVVDSDLAPRSFGTLVGAFDREIVEPRFRVVLVGLFATVALVLGSLGIYGVLAFTVASRTREIGVRLALGASPATIRNEVVGRVLVLTAAGSVLGLCGAVAAGTALRGLLYGVPPADPTALLAALAAVVIVAVWASALPAARASRVDPAAALRAE